MTTTATVPREVGTATTTLTYDYENRVTGITYPSTATNSFSYNGNDLRIKKVDSSGTYNYVTDGSTPASAVLSDGAATYTPGLSERRSGTSSFYHGDALGSNRAITNNSQSVTASTIYDGFGNTVSTTGSSATPFGFVGTSQYQQDHDSGLMLLGHRYYDSCTGRFITRDPAQAGTNWYDYADNNPLGKTDPTGLESGSENGWHQLGNFLLGEVRAIGAWAKDGIAGGLGGFLPNPFDPGTPEQGANESQHDGYYTGTIIIQLAELAASFVEGGGCFIAGTQIQMAMGQPNPSRDQGRRLCRQSRSA